MSDKILKSPPMVAFQEVSDERVIEHLSKISQYIIALSKYFRDNKISLPDVVEIEGKVSVQSLPDVHIANIYEFGEFFKNLERQFVHLTTVIQTLKINDQSPSVNFDPLIRSMGKSFASLEKSLTVIAQQVSQEKNITVEGGFPTEMADTLQHMEGYLLKLWELEANKVTFTPPAVTNVNINPLQGALKTSATTVSASPTAIPSYGVLANRRALVLFNNDTSKTIYYGDSGVSTATGIPVPPQSQSVVLDAGINIVPYAVTSSGSVNVRVLEISNTAKGG